MQSVPGIWCLPGTVCFLLMASSVSATDSSNTINPPTVRDADWEIDLIASEPPLVTPVGCCIDPQGRLLVIECHTHFPPDDYDGPQADRIYIFDDTDGDGAVDRQRLFYSGGSASMGLVSLPDGWIVVSTRSQVYRIRDSDGDDVADEHQVLLRLKTSATYPHNGLTGLAWGPDEWLYIGQGENLGDPYELIAADGTKQRGGGEGGNVFRCRSNGTDLQRVATGFWNPFGLTFDVSGRLWAVGNDPDARPPCRLLHVVETADYGFQFRFGRAGTHPLLSWDGEFPSTLPMTAGTGEAPCAVVENGNALWVTSWGDNRIERYELQAEGASWQASTQVVVQGTAQFRPVDFALAADGSMYVTDWADRSYPVHQKGRLWRLKPKTPAVVAGKLPPLTDAEKRGRQLAASTTSDRSAAIAALTDSDPFIRQFAIAALVASGAWDEIERAELLSPKARLGLLTAAHWMELCDPEAVNSAERNDWINWALQDSSEEVVRYAVRWAAERSDRPQLESIRKLLQRPDLSPEMFATVTAAIAYLETGSAARGRRDPALEKSLLEFAADLTRPPKLRGIAIGMLPPESEKPTDRQLLQWLKQTQQSDLQQRIVDRLSMRAADTAQSALAEIAGDANQPASVRADAVAGLVDVSDEYAKLLEQLAAADQPASLRREAKRVARDRTAATQEPRPSPDDLEAWNDLIGTGGDPAAGRRVFFRVACGDCHAHGGRGSEVGPDLTGLAGQMTRKRILESILQPSKEIGPLYVPWQVVTVDGRVLTGMKLNAGGVGTNLRYLAANGEAFEVPLADIEQQQPADKSIMPVGLVETMSLVELRDLLAFLANPATAP